MLDAIAHPKHAEHIPNTISNNSYVEQPKGKELITAGSDSALSARSPLMSKRPGPANSS
jgi:hypothetical protein